MPPNCVHFDFRKESYDPNKCNHSAKGYLLSPQVRGPAGFTFPEGPICTNY